MGFSSEEFWRIYKKRQEEEKKKSEETAPKDIAPVKEGLDLFQKGAFGDGFDLTDLISAPLATVADIGVGIGKGAAKMVGGIVDAGMYGVAGLADLVGADSFANDVRVKAQENTIDNAFKGVDDYLNQYSMLGRTSDAVSEGLGQVATMILTGVATGGLGPVASGAIAAGTMGVSSVGSGISEAYQSGATDEEAATYGLISGVVNAGSELIFGGLGKTVKALGISKGLSSLDDMFAKKLSSKIANQTAKNFVEYGVKASAEGVEEVLAGIGEAVGKKLTYMSEEELSKLVKDENLLEQFVVGAVTSGISQSGIVPGTKSGSLVEANQTGRDFITGLTENEQKVVDKVHKDLIADQEKDGKKLTEKEKNDLYDKVIESVERGEVSLDTIAEVLDNESYKAYKDMVAQEEKTAKGLAELYKGEELEKELANFMANTESQKMKDAMDEKVFGLVKDGKLAESYLERGRRGEAYQADLSKYDENQKATIQNAINSGILNNTRRTHEFVDLIAKISADKGIAFDFTSNEKLKDSIFAVGDGKTVNGFVTENGITLNVNSAKALNSVVGHEITHVLEGTELYNELKDVLESFAKSRKASTDNFKNEYLERYHNTRELYKDVDGYKGLKGEEKIKSEVIADLVGDYLFTDADFVNSLTANKNLFQKIYDEIKYLCKIATAGSKEARELEKIKRVFEQAYEQKNTTKTDGVLHSLTIKHTDGTVEELADARGLTNEQAVDYLKQAKSGKLQGGSYIPVRKDTPQVIIDTMAEAGEIVGNHSLVMQVRKAQQSMAEAKSDRRAGKFGSNIRSHALSADQIVEIVNSLDNPSMAIYQTNRHDKHGNPLPNNVAFFVEYNNNGKEGVAVIEFDSSIDSEFVGTEYGDTNYHTVVTVFEPDVERDGVEFDYAAELLSNPDNIELEIKRRQPEGSATREIHPNTSSELSSTEDTVPQTKPDVKWSVSDSDSDGRQISTEQQDVKVMEGGTVAKYSLSTWTPETQNKVRDNLVKAGYDADRVDKWIKDTNSVASVIAADKDRLDFEAADNQTMLKNNQEYVKTLDASTLCAKRLLYQGTFDAIQHRMPNTMLSSDDLISLLNMMKEHGAQTPCGVCYVESRRRHLGKFAQEWLDGYDGAYKPNLDEVTTSDGLEALRKSHPDTYEDFINAMKKKGSANPKVVQLRTEYRNEIMSLTPAQIRKIESIGGLRVQSFSDFETPHLLDMMQAVMDMSAKGLTSQAYTKVPNFAWVFGNTGIKINLSLIAEGNGFDTDGNLVFSSVEGMDFDEAMKLRDAYSENVGTIIVGANDKHILACMADDRIDFIIPFHRSGWGQNELDMMGMSSYTDYTYGQKEHDIKTGKGVENLYPPDYWDYNLSGKENAERYLNLCAKTGREPKFSHFLVNNGDGSYSLRPDGSTDGYWKTLIDFKMYNNDGVGAAQQKVQPNFNMEEAYRVLEEYEGGANKLPVANDVVDEFVAKYQSGSLRSLSAEGEQYAPIGNYNVSGKDIALDGDIAPVAQTETAKRTDTVMSADEKESPANQPIRTAQDRLNAQIKAVQTELDNDRKSREVSHNDFNEEIAGLRQEYEKKKNKNTKAANEILLRIERRTRMRDSVDAGYEKRINDLEAKLEKMNSKEYKVAQQRKVKQKEYADQMAELVGDTSTWQDKKMGLSYRINTLRRNLRDIVRDANGNRDIAKADAIYDEIQGKYNTNEAALNREATRIKDEYAKMEITTAEDAYIQMLGELRHNPDTTLTEDVVNEFYKKHKDSIDTAKVDKAIEMARQTYDELLERVNAVLREQGMKEIPYRKGYFPHFTEEKQGWLAKLLNWKVRNNEIPTDIAGLTEQFNPNRSWQSFNKQRKGDVTDYSFTKGLDAYVQGSLDWVYHIEDIQKRRALENHIRYIHSEQGVKDRIEAINNNEQLDADETQDQIDLVYREAGNPLNNFVTDLRAGTNTLAGKKSSLDRGMEELTNRKVYSVMTNISNRVSANMVAGSVSSALTNFIPITQSWGVVSPISSLRAMGETIRSTFRDDGMVGKSDFLTNRLRKADNLYKGTWDKVSEKVGALMEAIDSFTSQTVWRSKYMENMANGMSESAAIKDADRFAENVLAGRSRGNMPTIFDSKNPAVRMLTAFQLEVANQYGYMFKDMPQDVKNKSKANLVKGYATMFVGAYIYNALYSSITGRDAAFDPVGIIEELLRDMGWLGDDDEEEPVDAVMNLTENILQEVPFVGGLLGGGRVPISSALPYDGNITDMIEGASRLVVEGDTSDLTSEWLKPLYYVALPMGGGQIKKTVQGLAMFDDDLPISGSYTQSGKLRFPVEDTFLNRAKAAVFGQYSSKNARDYFDNGYAPIGDKQIQEFVDVDIPIRDYWEYRDGLKDQSTVAEKFDYIAGLDLPIDKKNILINNAVDRKEEVDMTNYDDFAAYEEFDWATKNPEQYMVSKAVTQDVSKFMEYTDALNEIKSDKDKSGATISGSRKKKVVAWLNEQDMEYGAKLILYKMEYPSDTQYNRTIIEYLKSKNELSQVDKLAILMKLGFSVDSNGNIRW